MTNRQGMTQDCRKSSQTVGSQTHAGVVHQSRFRNRGVTPRVRQLDRQRRRCPLAILHIGNRFPFMTAFVMTFEVVKPDGAAGGKSECAGFVSSARSFPRNHKTKRNPIVKDANVDGVTTLRGNMGHLQTRAVASIDTSGVAATGWVSLVQALTIDFKDCAILTKRVAVNKNRHGRLFDYSE